MQIVTADIGGTHARFALADIADDGRIALHSVVAQKTSQHASLHMAWQAFADSVGRDLPRRAAIAVACPVDADVLQLTNNPWMIRPARLSSELALDEVMLCNDIGAVAHSLSHLPDSAMCHVCGPDTALPRRGSISVLGAGTGLGAALVLRSEGHEHVIETEAGHIDFAPLDPLEDAMLRRLREKFRRVSVERIVSGPGLRNIYESIAAIEDRPVRSLDDPAIWNAALDGSDSLAAAAFDRFCLCLGAVAGDIALAHGSQAVVLAGGICRRLEKLLGPSGFASRFVSKGRFAQRMAAIGVKLIVDPQPGLLGAAAAFSKTHP
ncbi:MAG TPA: glucokinase [Rhizomicrobium sp.]|nr:glucokinase [Rhizomicrobium sp.]